MAASVLFACGLNEKTLPPFVHISEESHMDGSFLISSILGQRLRISNAAALLVCLQHNYQHYVNAGLRLGYNTNIFLDKTLSVIDPMSQIGTDGTDSEWLKNADEMVPMLVKAIREKLDADQTNRISRTILVDNLSILYNLGASVEQVQQLCHALVQLTQDYENLTVITKMSNCELYDGADNNVAKLSDLHIKVVKLKSGVFREVDGKLLVERYGEAGSFEEELKQKEILYKVNDRNIKIFNPGEVGAKG